MGGGAGKTKGARPVLVAGLYRDVSENAQNSQNVPPNGVNPEKITIFRYTGREDGPNAFFLTPASPKGEKNRTSAHGPTFYMG